MDIKNLRTKINKLKANTSIESKNEKGISIIIPVYNGIEFLERCLLSLEKQIITDARYEVILVLNGKYIQELEYLFSRDKYFKTMNLTILINDNSGAGAARNLGVKNAIYSHILFIDVDDFVSPNYIQANYSNLAHDTITISQIRDVVNDELLLDSPINDKVLDYIDKKLNNYRGLNRVLTITACKAIPTEYFINNQFRANLKSGEDTLLFTEILVNQLPKLKIIPFTDNSVYYREVRAGSISRQETSFDFNILQRIDILKILDNLFTKVTDFDLKTVVKYKYNAQIVLMNKYLQQHPEDYSRIIDLVRKENFNNFSFKILNSDLAETLVVSYCAPPYSDTSASIVTKRILESEKIVDVVSNRMDNIRGVDKSLDYLVEPYISNNIVNQKNASFSNFYFLSTYIDKVFQYYCNNIEKYKTIYSRAMFPISHIPPFFIKLLNENIYWKAEFSDPLLFDIESNKREAYMDYPLFNNLLNSGVLGGFTEFVDNNMFNLAEIIPFALADELIFTNNHQLNFMIERFPDQLKEIIIQKAIVSEHPTLQPKYYSIVDSSYKYNKPVINIAYFGNFYSRRGINEIIKIKTHCDYFEKSLVKIHIFTNVKQLSNEEIELLKVNDIIVNDYISYLEFLNLSNKMDVLLLFDSITSDIKNMNPYLPSKFSDYLGSDAKILAIVEKGSIMSETHHEKVHKLDYNDLVEDTNKIVYKLMDETLSDKKNYIEIENTKATIIKNDDIIFTISDNLSLKDYMHNGLLFKPESKNIKSRYNYTINLKNSSNQIKRFKINSFYSVRNIINITVSSIQRDYEYENCISTFRKKFEIVIPPNEEFVISMRYMKDYNKEGFKDAGRLLITRDD